MNCQKKNKTQTGRKQFEITYQIKNLYVEIFFKKRPIKGNNRKTTQTGEELERYFIKEYKWMENKHLERFSISLVPRKAG